MPSIIQFVWLLLLPLVARGTRLPLEVYELTPTTATGAAAHKSLEYTVYDAKDVATSATVSTSSSSSSSSSTPKPATEPLAVVSISAAPTDLQQKEKQQQKQQQQDLAESRRNARQMLQKQQQQQQQQHRLANSKHGQHKEKDLRILYQVGDSEDDLPICAPNAVCSKIDLYETPWIERQCRCPESNRLPNNVILHHHGHQASGSAAPPDGGSKYRNYYDMEMLQLKRLLLGKFQDKRFETLHMKKLMQKLGAVYEEDLDHVDQSPDYNDALPSSPYALPSELEDNEYPSRGSAHMRHAGHSGHSGHRGQKEAPSSYIGGCPSSLGVEDGHTIADKTRHYKMCQPVHKLPVCKHFRDYTWTLTTAAEANVTEQVVHCRCPRNSVTYLTKREPIGDGSAGYRYLFACSPLTRLRCQRKQPCKLFTVRKRQEFLDEVNINALCQCPKGHRCPSHHTQSGVIAGESFLEDNIQTYSGYCMAND